MMDFQRNEKGIRTENQMVINPHKTNLRFN